jgi:UTP--glucose-1-phosphate uridylyltransferase
MRTKNVAETQQAQLHEVRIDEPAQRGQRAQKRELRTGLRPLSQQEIGAAQTGRSGRIQRADGARAGILGDARLDWKMLRKYDFDAARFGAEQQLIAAGKMKPADAAIAGPLAPIGDANVTVVKFEGPEYQKMKALGEAALRRGEVAVVVLNGGMATRFGGVVKGVVDVFDNQSFIGLKAADVAKASKKYAADIPLVLMNSFQTHESTMKHVADRARFGLKDDQILTFQQSISIRMNPDGSLFVGDDGKPSYHAPGHGDFFNAIRISGVLDELKKRGVKTILFSNVDNLGATIDPALIGHHIAAGADMSAEVVEKRKTASGKWDVGASPVMVDGRVKLVEGFRLPADLSPHDYPDFSTNNFMFSVAGLDRDVPLERYVVEKKVDGRPVYQLESITCEASGASDANGGPLLKLNIMRTPRDGVRGRFFPIKEPIDLEANREILAERLREGWRLRDAE